MNKAMVAAVSLMGLALGGCATVLNGTNVDYAVKTDPAGAQVKFTTGAT